MPEWLSQLFIPPHLDEIDESNPMSAKEKRNAIRRWSLLISMIAFASIMHIGSSWFYYAKASDMEKFKVGLESSIDALKAEVSDGRMSQRYDTMSTELRRIEQALFDLESKISDTEARGKKADPLYYQRREELRKERGNTKDRIDAMVRTSPRLLTGT